MIEDEKKEFKQNNNLSDLDFNATSINERLDYNNVLFEAESPKDLAMLLKTSISKMNMIIFQSMLLRVKL